MSWIDVLIFSILAISSIIGAWRGMVRELLSLLFLVLAVVIAQSYGALLAEALTSVLDNAGARYFFAVCCLFVVPLIAARKKYNYIFFLFCCGCLFLLLGVIL